MHGFTVIRTRENKEINGRLVEMVHDRTGARLCWVDNKALNKLFSVAFKTLPEDSTGVFHILEHSVLCGSDKYPVREPFVELLKSSMNTFLNAMTFQDKTMYPVSSRNEKDFLNLTEVYLDAVFAPAILKNPNIFYQEGIHIEENNGELSYKGVVFNEMKGAFGNVDELANQFMTGKLFENNAYGYCSGGDPEHIPDLTYEQFCETYKRFYHPSNSYFFLDGDVPIERTLELIDSYLCKFDRLEKLPEAVESNIKGGRVTHFYEPTEKDDFKDKSMLSVGKIACSWKDKLKTEAIQVLTDVILGTNESPLKRAILSSGLAKDVSMYVDDSVFQPYIMLTCKNVKNGSADELAKLISSEALRIAEEGIDKKQLLASISQYEFKSKEPEEPAGLVRNISALSGWLHGGDPLEFMTDYDDFPKLREMVENGGFDALLKELLASPDELTVVESVPSATYGDETRAKENARLKAIGDTWSEKDRENNRLLNEGLQNWQATPDSMEALATLPELDLSDVNEIPEMFDTEESVTDGVKVLFHKGDCHGIIHFTAFFKMADASRDDLQILGFTPFLFGKLPTKNHTALELQQKIKEITGRMNFGMTVKAPVNDLENATPYFVVKASVLPQDYKEAVELAREILLETDWSDKEKIREIIEQTDEDNRQYPTVAGHSIGMGATLAHYSSVSAANEALMGYSFIVNCHKIKDSFDEEWENFSGVYIKLQKRMTRERLLVTFTANELPDASAITGAFPSTDETSVPSSAVYKTDIPGRMGCEIPAQIGYATQAYNMAFSGFKFDGKMKVASNIISLCYLWNVVRVRGGAYGSGISIRNDNLMCTYSYRDPTPARSLDINGEISDFLKEFYGNEEKIDRYIISAIASTEPLISPRVLGIRADDRWFSGITREDEIRTRREMLATTKEDLLNMAGLFDDMSEKGAVCVIAQKEALAKCTGLEIKEI